MVMHKDAQSIICPGIVSSANRDAEIAIESLKTRGVSNWSMLIVAFAASFTANEGGMCAVFVSRVSFWKF